VINSYVDPITQEIALKAQAATILLKLGKAQLLFAAIYKLQGNKWNASFTKFAKGFDKASAKDYRRNKNE
jgi:hypothetical protein